MGDGTRADGGGRRGARLRNVATPLRSALCKALNMKNLQDGSPWNVVPIGVAPEPAFADALFMGIRRGQEMFSPLFTTYSQRPPLHCRSGPRLFLSDFGDKRNCLKCVKFFFANRLFAIDPGGHQAAMRAGGWRRSNGLRERGVWPLRFVPAECERGWRPRG